MSKTDWDVFRLPPPHDGYDCVRIKRRIRLNATGEVREADDYCLWDENGSGDGEEGPSTFIWSDGNYACDCNRAIDFGPDQEDESCGSSRYAVQLVNAKTGTVFYDEFNKP